MPGCGIMGSMDPRYPIGKPNLEEQTPLPEAIEHIAAMPGRLRQAVRELGESRLETPYREGGWTALQVVHHFADSHLHGFVHSRLALTEDCPTIKPYNEKLWAELDDARTGPVEPSLNLIDGLHARWVSLLRSMKPEDFERKYRHPGLGELTLAQAARLYAWHCRHHLAHLRMILSGQTA
jgi:hypothetical protein